MLLATPPDPWAVALPFLGFAAIMITLYIFREKRTDRLPADVTYDYEGAVSNQKLELQIDRNAYLHTLAPTYKGAMYGLHNDHRKKRAI